MGRHGPDDEDDDGAARPKVAYHQSTTNNGDLQSGRNSGRNAAPTISGSNNNTKRREETDAQSKRQGSGLELATPEGNVMASQTGGNGNILPPPPVVGASPLRHPHPKREESLAYVDDNQYDSQVPGATAVPGVRAPPPPTQSDTNVNRGVRTDQGASVQDPSAPIVAHLAPTDDDLADRIAERVQQQVESKMRRQEQRQRQRQEQQEAQPQVYVPQGQVAQAVQMPANKTADDNEDTFLCGMSFKCFVFVGAIGFLGVVAIAAGVVIAVVGGTEETNSPTPSPTTASPTTIAPTTLTPTALPTTTAPVGEVFSPRFEQALERFGPLVAADDISILQDTSTIQHWALRWIADEDPAELDYDAFPAQTFIDRYVMVLFYNMTSGDQAWLNQYHFLTSRPTCAWSVEVTDEERDLTEERGVLCSEQTIQGIRLRQNGLQGSMPTEVGLLTGLELLDLTDNFMLGTFPTFLAEMPSLKTLWFATNAFGGSLPTDISNFDSLKSLDLTGNGFSGTIPTEIGLLPEIREISVSKNFLYGTVPTELAQLSNLLDTLAMEQCQFTGTIPTELGRLTAVEYLHLGGNELAGQIPSELGEMTAMTSLFLNQNNLSGQVPSELGRLSLLIQFYLFDNARITGRIPLEFAQLSLLVEVAVQGTALTGGIEETMCAVERLIPFTILFAECRGAPPDIQCSCCTFCCRDGICVET